MSVADRLSVPALEHSSTDRRDLETPAVKATLGTLAWTLLVLATVADLLTTAYGLELGARESNPVGRYLIFEHGFATTAVLKVTVLGVVAAGSVAVYLVERRWSDRDPIWWLYYPALVAPIWMGAAAWNALLITGFVR